MDAREIDAYELYDYYHTAFNRQEFVDLIVEEKAVSFPDRELLHRYWDIIDATVDMRMPL